MDTNNTEQAKEQATENPVQVTNQGSPRWQIATQLLNFTVKFPWPFFAIVFLGMLLYDHQDLNKTIREKDAAAKAQTEFMINQFVNEAREAQQKNERYELLFHNVNTNAVDTLYIGAGSNTGAGRHK